MAEVLRQVGTALPFIGVGLAIIGGLIGLRLAYGGAMRQRADRGNAARTGLALAAVGGGLGAVFVAMIASSFTGGNWPGMLPAAAVIAGLPVAGVVFGAAAAGYAFAARVRPAGDASIGAALGPLALLAICLAGYGLSSAANQMDADAAQQQHIDEVAARSTGLHLTVDEATTTLDGNGLVASVHMVLRLRSDTDLGIAQLPGKVAYPLFVLSPTKGNDPNTEIQVEAPAGSPQRLEAGIDARYELTFEGSHAPTQSPPGDWTLEVRIGGSDELAYGLTQQVAVTP